ncbi:MAG: tRNA (adenosine(37)-N6)-threonylcarbamoyltransferase complex transferase subunit TsaD [Rhodospirillales bacterium]|nr:tRNA (adenosine(37)-N6)-threonylcarbamoyltransferase complex transferase subunit TsaD [Rhodospirillales bacterium]
MIVLGIETSCDETAAALVTGDGEILADEILSQETEHAPYGGIVPEVAARAHLQHLDRLIEQALAKAQVGFDGVDAVAATGGPGLIGGVIVGVMTAKAIAAARGIPFLAVNHLEGHALSPRLSEGAANLDFPYLLLLASGGHCQFLIVEGVGRYRRLGTTVDDALGEAFDKVAKMLGLGFPGGPPVEATAKEGSPKRFTFPRPLKGRPGCDFSFSGLKTAVRHAIDALPPGPILEKDVTDLAASFQAAAVEAVADRASNALDAFARLHSRARAFVIAGGVAANQALRESLAALADARGFRLVAPPLRLCTDNAAMIAWAGVERLRLGLTDPLDFAPRPRWPLDPHAPRAQGAGVKA